MAGTWRDVMPFGQDIDLTVEDTERQPEAEWPEPDELKPADAAALVLRYQKEATDANTAAAKAKENKDRAEAIGKAVLEHYELDSIKPRDVPLMLYTEEFKTFTVADKSRFDPWEAEQDESYYETKLKLRDIFLEHCRRLDDDGEELPPGVVKYQETRLRRRAIPQKKAS